MPFWGLQKRTLLNICRSMFLSHVIYFKPMRLILNHSHRLEFSILHYKKHCQEMFLNLIFQANLNQSYAY